MRKYFCIHCGAETEYDFDLPEKCSGCQRVFAINAIEKSSNDSVFIKANTSQGRDRDEEEEEDLEREKIEITAEDKQDVETKEEGDQKPVQTGIKFEDVVLSSFQMAQAGVPLGSVNRGTPGKISASKLLKSAASLRKGSKTHILSK